MTDKQTDDRVSQNDNRRAFLNRAGKIASAAPAAALLLAASTRQAAADATPTSSNQQPGDSFAGG